MLAINCTGGVGGLDVRTRVPMECLQRLLNTAYAQRFLNIMNDKTDASFQGPSGRNVADELY